MGLHKHCEMSLSGSLPKTSADQKLRALYKETPRDKLENEMLPN